MAMKRTIITPQCIVLPKVSFAATVPTGFNAKTAAAGDYEVLTPKFAGWDISEDSEPVDVSSSENVRNRAYTIGLTTFTVELTFQGGDTENDYTKLKDLGIDEAFFILVENAGPLSGDNNAFVFTGIVTGLPRPAQRGAASNFTATIMPGPSNIGIEIADAAADITTGTTVNSGYASAPVT